MKRDSGRTPTIVWVAAVLCLVVAVGAALQGQFRFGGPRWSPQNPDLPAAVLTPPPQSPAPTAQPPSAPTHTHQFVFNWVPILVALGVILVAGVAFLVRRWLLRRLRAGDSRTFSSVATSAEETPLTAEREPDLPTLRRGLSFARDMLTTTREPRDAIVRAWIGLQEAAEDSGMSRRPAETPTEFTSRVFATVRADRDAAETLLGIYLRVRFGSHPATADDVRLARDAVARLAATWPAEADAFGVDA